MRGPRETHHAEAPHASEAINATMNVEVIAYGYLMTLIGGKQTVELKDPARLDDLTAQLAAKAGSSKRGHVGPYKVDSDLIVLINGRNVKGLKKPHTLTEGDVVTLIPPYVGG
jgi:molybdopterin converting factor small subunit